MSEYRVVASNGRVILPAAGRDGVGARLWRDDDARDNLEGFVALLGHSRLGPRLYRAPAVLLRHTENSYNSNAISVSVPVQEGSSRTGRHLGYLYDHFLWKVGKLNLPDLIDFAGGEVECTVILGGRDVLAVDLPEPATLGEAVRIFLEAHGIQASGTPRSVGAPPEKHTHRGSNPSTARALGLLGRFPADALPVTALTMSPTRYRGFDVRTLGLRESTSNRWLGMLDGRRLTLDDERDREAVLRLLDREGIPVLHPVVDPKVREDGSWPTDVAPNARVRHRRGGLDLQVDGPDNQEPLAVYNPTTGVLWVQDSRLVPPALRFMHRQGIDVAKVGLPRRSWGLEAEIPYQSLRDRKLQSAQDYWERPPLLRSASSLIPSELGMPDSVVLIDKGRSRQDPEPSFAVLEKLVKERSILFPVHALSDERVRCRLCDGHATAFTTPIATEALAYCHGCLANAVEGLVQDRVRSGAAIKELSRLEFDGQPMLASQLESLHVDPENPVDAESLDRLLLLRWGVVRKNVPWTLLLEAAGFGEDGLRTGRGTLIRSRDGHLCLSLRERAVCDFMHQHSIKHDHEPMYPRDSEYNPHGLRRADWVLADGTLVELWGLPNDERYAAKMRDKRLLAKRHGLRLVEIFDRDLPRLPDIFKPWLSAGTPSPWSWSPLLVRPPSATHARRPETIGADDRGRNAFNREAQRARVVRCADAVRLQSQGLSRREIAQQLGVEAETVKNLLRDGKFYASPAEDPARAELAELADLARELRLTRAQFQAEVGLTAAKAQAAWRDAEMLRQVDSWASKRPDASRL